MKEEKVILPAGTELRNFYVTSKYLISFHFGTEEAFYSPTHSQFCINFCIVN